MQSILDDLRYALRQLRKSPGFTLTAVLTLAIGIGATTAIFTLVYDVLLKPLPYTHPGQLVVMEERVAEVRDIYPTLPVNANHFEFWQHNSHSFQSMAVMEEGSMPLGVSGQPLQIDTLSATPGLFAVLDVSPELGRAFTPQEAETGREHVVVLMNNLWRQQFQSDPGILGKTISLNGLAYTVIGVMPPSFHLPHTQSFGSSQTSRSRPVAALLPLAFSKERLAEAMGDFNSFGIARLKPGVSVSQATDEINAMEHAITAGLSADQTATLSALLTPLQTALVADNQKPLLLLLGAVATLLLVGCVNITNLLLARATGRRQQIAVAAALGASRVELLRMAMRETAVLAALGGLFGIELAAVLVPALQQYLPQALNFRGPLQLDWIGGSCALLLAMMATLLAGAAPAWITSRSQPQEVLHSESRLATESRASKRLRRVLVAVEVAVSMALLLMTGLLTTSLFRLLHVDRGFQAENTLTATITLPTHTYAGLPARAAFYREVLRRIAQLPGVQHAAAVSVLPLTGDSWIDMARVPGDPRPDMQLPTQHFRWITPEYFETLHIPLKAGRFLAGSDEGRHYALVSQLTAKTLWPGQDPIGRQFLRAGMKEDPFTVIGVVGNARTVSLATPDPMMVYVPYWYRADPTAGLIVRTQQGPAVMADALRKAIWSVDPQVPVPAVRALGGVVADSVENRRFEMDLLLLFAVSALLLAGLGVYGVVNYSVVQRQREIGLRLALGAPRESIQRLMLWDGLMPVIAGAAIGTGFAYSFAWILRSLLFEVSRYNFGITAATLSILMTLAAAACLLPARRAASIDPMKALRRE